MMNELAWGKSISGPEIESWLSNFTGEVFERDYEHVLVLWLLLNYVHYNEGEVEHLCCSLYKNYMHYRIERGDGNIDDKKLKSVFDSTIFASLGRAGESGASVLYSFRKANELPLNSCLPKTGRIIDSRVNTIAFIDDVTLSSDYGSQAWKYLKKELEIYEDYEIHLLTLLATESAVSFLKDKGIKVFNTITLNDSCRAFSENSYVYKLNPKYLNDTKKLAFHYGEKCMPGGAFGYGGGQYLFGFHYNVPDNTLPIIWSTVGGWKPIFKRHHKNYGGFLLIITVYSDLKLTSAS